MSNKRVGATNAKKNSCTCQGGGGFLSHMHPPSNQGTVNVREFDMQISLFVSHVYKENMQIKTRDILIIVDTY